MRKNTEHADNLKLAEEQELSAGIFSLWLRRTRSAMIKENGAEVPCGDCNACCRSSYFIHIRPGEAGTLSSINKKLLFPAPGLPKGNVLLGYGKNGSCPMLTDNMCLIYKNRSITCRSYDCRIFAAAGIPAGDEDKALINKQIRRWKFSYPTNHDYDLHVAVKAAAAFLIKHGDRFPGGAIPQNPLQIAIVAIKVYGVFMKHGFAQDNAWSEASISKILKEIRTANEKFEARYDSHKLQSSGNNSCQEWKQKL